MKFFKKFFILKFFLTLISLLGISVHLSGVVSHTLASLLVSIRVKSLETVITTLSPTCHTSSFTTQLLFTSFNFFTLWATGWIVSQRNLTEISWKIGWKVVPVLPDPISTIFPLSCLVVNICRMVLVGTTDFHLSLHISSIVIILVLSCPQMCRMNVTRHAKVVVITGCWQS